MISGLLFRFHFFFSWILDPLRLSEIHHRARIIGSETRPFSFPLSLGGLSRGAREEIFRETTARLLLFPSLSFLLLSFCRSFNLLHRLPAGYQSSKSNNIISLRLPVRGPIPFPRAWRNPTVEFMADSVAVTPAVGLHKGVQGTYSHAST